jgi:hypothetical protein
LRQHPRGGVLITLVFALCAGAGRQPGVERGTWKAAQSALLFC